MKRFWMRSLTGQWIALMLLALGVSQMLFFFIYRGEQIRTMRELRRDEFLARTAAVARLVATVGASVHEDILRATNTISVRYWLTSDSPLEPETWQKTAREKLLESPRPPLESDLQVIPKTVWEPLKPEDWSANASAQLLRLDSWNGFGLGMQIKENLWLYAVYAKPGIVAGPSWFYYVSLVITAILLSLISVLVARRVGRPLQKITDSAERLGRGEEVALLPEEGADDIRRTATAFNQMQSRLRKFVEDRTRMMAAISHDLRTPITSMRLRAEFIEDTETKEKLIATLDEMKAMTEATLAFAREEATVEATRNVDINALLVSLCDDLSDLGWEINCADGERIPWSCRADALRRALRNLIENAVRYGKRARVSVASSHEALEIIVDDDGPGIAAENQERVFSPFVRLEDSRNRSTGGVGLGLSIARTIARAHGGDIHFFNRPEGGLRVTFSLPRN